MRGNNTKLKLQARETGQRFYTTGAPCNNGHVGRRYASNGCCVECLTGKSDKPLNEGQVYEGMFRHKPPAMLMPKAATAEILEELDGYLVMCAHHLLSKKGLNVGWLDGAYQQSIGSGRHVGDFLP